MSAPSSQGSTIELCSICKKPEINFGFSCGHKVCIKCLLQYILIVLKNFKQLLDINTQVLNGKLSCLGCPKYCPESDLSLSLRLMYQYAELDLSISPQDKELFRNMTEIGASFFSGIRTYFFNCKMCNSIGSDTQKTLHVCRPCIHSLIKKQTNSEPISFTIDWQEKNEILETKPFFEGASSFLLVCYDENNQTYVHQKDSHSDNYLICKFQDPRIHTACVLIRAIEVNKGSLEASIITVESLENNVQIIAKISNITLAR